MLIKNPPSSPTGFQWLQRWVAQRCPPAPLSLCLPHPHSVCTNPHSPAPGSFPVEPLPPELPTKHMYFTETSAHDSSDASVLLDLSHPPIQPFPRITVSSWCSEAREGTSAFNSNWGETLSWFPSILYELKHLFWLSISNILYDINVIIMVIKMFNMLWMLIKYLAPY